MRIALAATLALVVTASADAQTLGTFRWRVAPYGSVLNLTITQVGSIYRLEGFEQECGGLNLPVTGVAVAQSNGTIMFGMTTIQVGGRGLHTLASISIVDLNGGYSDNSLNNNQPFLFHTGPPPCPGGPRSSPTTAATPRGGDLTALSDAMAALEARLTALEAKQK
ncbi:MAG: hypothetical protein R2745_24560 [Vicinamibacterales bacterium]